MELRGSRVLVTGATGGLGGAIATALAERGARLVLSSRSPESLAVLAERLPGEGHETLVADLGEPGAAEALAERAGELDAVVANAGVSGSGRIEEFDPARIELTTRVNLEAPIRLFAAALPAMRERRRGQIVAVTSLNDKFAPPLAGMYCATKFGLRGFCMSLREELHGSGVGVSIVAPGFVRDAGMFHASGARAPFYVGTATPEQVGAAVVRAIAADVAEIEVAPLRQRIGAAFAHRYPRLSARFTRKAATALAERVAAGQARGGP
ncbi:SDR family NAD(P)-dependent oxidoreductase [Thermoleophilia bacterium SCSIO 60948]|nr:SDR family NAD(P)-dependent oxidoreductase [Thermoleophilia bacterium SCSIO 60948]